MYKRHAGTSQCELYSIGKMHYFGNNGELYTLRQDQLDRILLEIDGMNVYTSSKHLVDMAQNGSFNKVHLELKWKR